MDTFNDLINSEVTRYMRSTGLSQAALGAACGIRQTDLSKRLRGATRWTVNDLDRLTSAGVPITLTTTTLEGAAS
nr:MAG TPA: SOS-response transcriptional repressor [Caudoviricetes sp.]